MVEHIRPAGSADGSAPLRKSRALPAEAAAADTVTLSDQVKGIRLEKVLEIRRAIANGTYLTDEKLDIALDRAIDDAAGRAR